MPMMILVLLVLHSSIVITLTTAGGLYPALLEATMLQLYSVAGLNPATVKFSGTK